MRKSRAVIFFPLLILLSTCTKDAYNPDVCFQENILPVFISNCTMSGCHNSTDKEAGYDLTNYNGIMQGVVAKHPLRSEVYLVIRGKNPSMPVLPYPKLSGADVTHIKIWIEMGAPNSSNCVACDTINCNYSSRVAPILQAWCVGCHNPGNSGGGINLADYAGVASAVAGNKLFGSIQHLPGYFPMPQGGDPLPSCDITAIRKWIAAGYPDN